MKTVAVQEDLVDIREALNNKGYKIIDFKDEGHVDAIVYTNHHSGIASLNNDVSKDNLGAVLVNSTNKSIEEIVYIIEKRRYGSLFS
ncbi:YkuS family protein [Alkaliphilus hydrothermalis]|uniref:YkuS family protein n=1 Tax=Alkaliphilus hydrothermalis TaxID=1482730 RepID=A0ABS2NRX0_9FIRM|nr:YkuS family protein [Alkaliphilus hydrothermalis]MBM7615576.1 hypothetical protein [Alkaliphilus hydrothermalis]